MADSRATDSVLGLFLRLYWVMLGNGALVVVAALPLAYPKLPAASLLAAYLFCVLSLIATRYVDIRFCAGQTKDGDPANLGHWKRYVAILVLSAAGLLGFVWAVKLVI